MTKARGATAVCCAMGAIRLTKSQADGGAAGTGLQGIDSELERWQSGYRGDRRGLLFGECQIGSEAGAGERRGVAGGGEAGYSCGGVCAAEDQVERGGIRAGKEGAGAVYGGAAAELDEVPEPPDAADALAIAICHIHTAQTLAAQGVGR